MLFTLGLANNITVLYGLTVAFLLGLCWISWIDIKTFRLPDSINYSLLSLGLLQAYLMDQKILLHIMGAVLGYGAFVSIEIAFKAIRNKNGLGRGDAKLLAVAGAWCGVYALPIIVAIASLSAILTILILQKNHQARIPFGTFLSFGMFGVWIVKHFYY